MSDIFPYHCICGNWHGLYVNAHQRGVNLIIHVICMILCILWLYNIFITWNGSYVEISLIVFLSCALLYYTIVTILVGFRIQWYNGCHFRRMRILQRTGIANAIPRS